MIRTVSFLVVLAASAAALGQSVTVTISPTENLSHVELGIVADGSSLGFGTLFGNVDGVPDIAAGASYTGTFDTGYPSSFPILYVSVLAVYTDPSTSATGATIGFSTPAGMALITSSAPWPFLAPLDETKWISDPILAYYRDSDQVQLLLEQMLFSSGGSLLPPAPGNQGQLVDFSNGTNGGTMSVAAVPEAAPLLGIGIGLAGLLRRRRK